MSKLENYEVMPTGVIHQKTIVNKLKDYNKQYVDERYNSYGEKGMQMAYLRLGYLQGVIRSPINRILDVGYGNGDFLKACQNSIPNTFGHDVSEYPLPENSIFVSDIFKHEFDVVCFFDSLEHFENIDFLKKLKTLYIYISLPDCHNYFRNGKFMDWKHRREDEHLWHFNQSSLVNFMFMQGYDYVAISDVEDCIRGTLGQPRNILTGIFKCMNDF
jgi:hypothetical protein